DEVAREEKALEAHPRGKNPGGDERGVQQLAADGSHAEIVVDDGRDVPGRTLIAGQGSLSAQSLALRPTASRCALTPASDGSVSRGRAASSRSSRRAGSAQRSSKSPSSQHGPSTPKMDTLSKPAASSSARSASG